MQKYYTLLGDVNAPGRYLMDEEMSLRALIALHSGGIINHQRIKLVQIGGALGSYVSHSQLDQSLQELALEDISPVIMVFGQQFCPVDHMRFLVRFVIREAKIDNPLLRKIYQCIEDIENKKADQGHLEKIKNLLETPVETHGEYLLFRALKEQIKRYPEIIEEHISGHKCRQGICRGLIDAQCINACPAEIHIPGYVEMMKTKDYHGAYALMRQSNPLSFICAKVCARPCEARCRRREIEKTVGVRALQRFAAEKSLRSDGFQEDMRPLNGLTVGIVGAGPAGLSAAYYLQRTGYAVTLYEKQPVVGGMLAFGVPEYRMPYSDIIDEVETIKKLGVDIKLNSEIGNALPLRDLSKRHNAIVLACGTQIGNGLEALSVLGPGSYMTAVDFLRGVRLTKTQQIGQTVMIIGGGDVAIDVARTSVRLGAKKVVVASLESFHEMPASEDERTFALEEGVEFVCGYGFSSVQIGGESHRITLKRCLSVFDAEDRFMPEFDEEDILTFDTRQVIVAIGQSADISLLKSLGIFEKHQLGANENTGYTHIDGVFAVGDMVKASIAIDAIAGGKRVARSVDRYLGGSGLYTGPVIAIPESLLNITTWDDGPEVESVDTPGERTIGFRECVKTLKPEAAEKEASRCMRCDRNSKRVLGLKPACQF